MASDAAVSCVRHIIEEYKRFLRTSYNFLDDGLRKQFEDHLEGADVVLKGPYVTLARDFETGKPLRELVDEGIANPGLLKANWAFKDFPLFAHQEQSFRIGHDKRCFMVTTGTGSGKTECFLLPVIDHCLRNPGKGVKAVLMYPMNALANDQLERMRRLFRDSGLSISFALYTGDSDKTSTTLKEPALEEVERITRQQIRQDPPDILLTNFKQLEFLLIRKEDRHLFTRALKFLVLDEIHTYRGALATEIACLIRRLKAHSGLKPGELMGIGTSATVAEGKEGVQSLARFGTELFGEEFRVEDVVTERYKDIDPEGVPEWLPAPPDILDEDIRDISIDDTDKIERLAQKLLGKSIAGSEDLTERIKAAIKGNRIVTFLEDKLKRPGSLIDIAESVAETFPDRTSIPVEQLQREIEAYLLLGSIGNEEHPPRLRPKLHLFCHGIYDVNICLNPECRKLIPHGSDTCPVCGSKAMPAALCRTCGQDFVKVKIFEGSPNLKPDDSYISDKDRTAFLTPRVNVFADAQDESGEEVDEESCDYLPGCEPPEEIDDGLEGIMICPRCGRITEGQICDQCEGKAVEYRIKRGKGHKCPACGMRQTKMEILTPLRTGTASTLSVLMHFHLDRLNDEDRKLLVFADNRQDAAHQVGYARHRQRQFVIRHLIEKFVRESPDGVGIDRLPYLLLDGFKQLGLIPFKPGKEAERNWLTVLTHEVASEFCRPTHQRISLENLGLIAIEYDYLTDLAEAERFKEICEKAEVSTEVGVGIVRAVLDRMRRQRAVNYSFFQEWLKPETGEYLQLQGEPYHLSLPDGAQNCKPMAFAFDRPQSQKNTYTAIARESNKGQAPALHGLVSRSLGGKPHLAEGFLRGVFALLLEQDYELLEISKKVRRKDTPSGFKSYQVRKDKIRLVQPTKGYRCQACRIWRPYDFVTCPTPSCKKGKLVEEEVNRENYYVHLYTDRPPQRMRLEEHTAQIRPEDRAERESKFKEGKLEILVCSPTLELGVDIGPLLTVVLRNAPPTPANYAQRVGRAGRRLRIGFVSTFCGPGAHDRHAFERPEWLITGEFKPPIVRLDNPRIVDRHLRSYLLEQVHAQLPKLMKEFVDNLKQPQNFKREALDELYAELRNQADSLAVRLAQLFEPDLTAGRTTIYDENHSRQVIAGFNVEADRVLNDWWNQVLRLDQEFNEFATIGSTKYDMRKANARMRAYKEITTDQESAYTLNYMAMGGLLPSYQFPTDVFALDPGVDDTPTLRRSAVIALGEFAPGNLVYANNRKLRSIRAIYSSPKGSTFAPKEKVDLDSSGRTQSIYFCRHCDTAVEELKNKCPTCGELLDTEATVAFLENFEAEEQTKITSDEESRDRAFFLIKESLIETADSKCELYKYPFAPLEHRKETKLLVTNWGKQTADYPEGEKFNLCSDCGRHRRADPFIEPEEAAKWDEWHAKFCGGQVIPLVLGYEFSTNVLVVSVPYPAGEAPDSEYSEAFMHTLAEALLLGSAIVLEVEVGEIGSFVRRRGPGTLGPQVILYETVPGGAGYLEDLAKSLPLVAEKGCERLFNHECARACYRCLKRYGNQRFHTQYDKESVRAILFQLAGEQVPAPVKVAANDSVAALKADLDSREEERKHEPESPIEQILFDAIKAYPELPEPLPQYEVKKGDVLITVPDFAYVDEKIAIFCDGYQYHGDRETLEGDASKRNYLQSEGWSVLVYWGRQIKDNPMRVVKQIAEVYNSRYELKRTTLNADPAQRSAL